MNGLKIVRVGYLDQHIVLEKGMTIEDVLKSAFDFLFEMEENMNDICNKMGDADEKQLEIYMDELAVIQDMLTMQIFNFDRFKGRRNSKGIWINRFRA